MWMWSIKELKVRNYWSCFESKLVVRTVLLVSVHPDRCNLPMDTPKPQLPSVHVMVTLRGPVQVLRAKRGHLKRGQWEAPREWGKMEGGPLETSLCETLHCSACWDRKVWGQCGPLMGHHLSLEFTASLLANCTSMPMAPWICHMHAWKGHNVEFYGHHEYHCEPWELICLLS